MKQFVSLTFIVLLLASLAEPVAIVKAVRAEDVQPSIDRHAVMKRHDIECNTLATTLPLGNGEFCFTADATGLQTFAGNSMRGCRELGRVLVERRRYRSLGQ